MLLKMLNKVQSMKPLTNANIKSKLYNNHAINLSKYSSKSKDPFYNKPVQKSSSFKTGLCLLYED